MKIILLQNVQKIGKKYDIKNVSDGHALNLLIPKGLAMVATDASIKQIENLKATDETMKKVHNDLLLKNLEDLEGVRVEVFEKANEKGHLFAGIHNDELSAIIKNKTELDILPECILLEKPIKEIGEHTVSVKIENREAKFTLIVQPVE